MATQTVAVLYGSRSPEHEVSVITALQVMQNLDPKKYNILPIYISKSGHWYLGDSSFFQPESYKNLDTLVSGRSKLLINPPVEISQLTNLSFTKNLPPVDIFFPVFHGSFGEDGTVQGLLEMLNVPYVGSGVLASAVGMDKLIQKQVFSTLGLSQTKYLWFFRSLWQTDPKNVLKSAKSLHFPVFVKPVNGGSSIGITRVEKSMALTDAVDVAAAFDRKIIVEEAVVNCKEINISVLGNSGSSLTVSVSEMVLPKNGLLTYKDKYQTPVGKSAGSKAGMASAGRQIPAPLKPITAKRIAEMAKIAYSGLDCSGLARVDFLVSSDEKKIYINEINTLPGSLAFYLWQPAGIPFPQLLDRLIELGLERFRDRARSTYTFSSNILSNLGETLKGGKLKG
jgi:D-alanine-D-alanine ligase